MTSTNITTCNNLSVSGNTTLSGSLISSSSAQFTSIQATSINATSFIGNTSGTISSFSNSSISNILSLLSSSPITFIFNGVNYSLSSLMLYTLFELSGGNLATQSYVNSQISALISTSPTLLSNLQEIASAINNDPNFATDITTLISQKAGLTSNNLFTGSNTFSGNLNTFNNNIQVNGTINNYNLTTEFNLLLNDITNIKNV